MTAEVPGLAAAFAAGLLSFLSPCVLPLVPGYLSFITGRSASAVKAGGVSRPLVLARTVFFILGFATVFVALGFLFRGAFAIGGLRRTLTAVAGGVVVAFGLNTVFEFARFLEVERRFHPVKGKGGPLGAFLLGVAFAAGWSPCVGPMLGSILLYAGRSGSELMAGALLASYTAGLSLPFLAAGLWFERTKPLLDFFKRHGLAVRIVSGLLLVGLGTAMLFGQLAALNGLLPRAGYALEALATEHPETARLAALGVYVLLFCLSTLVAVARGRKAGDGGPAPVDAAPDGPAPFDAAPDPAVPRKAAPRGALRSPWRIAFLALVAVAAAGELAGFWSSAKVVAGWLLFQGG